MIVENVTNAVVRTLSCPEAGVDGAWVAVALIVGLVGGVILGKNLNPLYPAEDLLRRPIVLQMDVVHHNEDELGV